MDSDNKTTAVRPETGGAPDCTPEWQTLRNHLKVGSWFGHAAFAVYGLWFAISYGGFGGIQYFADMFLIEQLGRNFAALLGLVFGVFIGLLCVWAICVIVAAFIGAVVYFIRFKSFPSQVSQ